MKRIIAFLLSALLLFSLAAVAVYADDAGSLSISVSAKSGKPGDTITVTYSLNHPAVKALAIEPKLIDELELTSVKWLLTGGALVDEGTLDDPYATFAYAASTPVNGAVLEAVYKVKADAEVGTIDVGYNEFVLKSTDEGGKEYDVYNSTKPEESSSDFVVPSEPTSYTIQDHDYNIKAVGAVAATCDKDGNIAYYICTNCGKYFSDKDHVNEIDAADVVIPALGHKFPLTHVEAKAATCTEDGANEHYICEQCKKYFADEDATTEIEASKAIIPALGHAWGEWIVEKEATETEDGYQYRVCANDATHVEGKAIPAKGSSTSDFDNAIRRDAYLLYLKKQKDKAAAEAAAAEAEKAADTVAEETPAIVDASALPFTDVVAGTPFYDAIEFVYEAGLFKGVSDTEFDLWGDMTRGMFVTVLGRLDGVDVEAYAGTSFADVAEDAYYAPYVEWAAENGIVLGYGDGNFGPDDSVTQEQAAVIIARYARYLGVDTSSDYNLEGYYEWNHTDYLSDWAEADVAWAVENNIYILIGYGDLDGHFYAPEAGAYAPRWWVANALYNFVAAYADTFVD